MKSVGARAIVYSYLAKTSRRLLDQIVVRGVSVRPATVDLRRSLTRCSASIGSPLHAAERLR